MALTCSRLRLQRTRVGALSLLLGAAALGIVCRAGAKDFLWRVRSPTTTVYLLGSVHVLRNRGYPLPASILPWKRLETVRFGFSGIKTPNRSPRQQTPCYAKQTSSLPTRERTLRKFEVTSARLSIPADIVLLGAPVGAPG